MDIQQYILLCAYILAGLLGLLVGSFLTVMIYRLPKFMNLFRPGSHCTRCGNALKWYDNIPVLSYLLLGGKCRQCKEPISPRYILVELANMALWLVAAALFWKTSPVYACAVAIACSALICIFVIDLEHLLIFNRFTLILACCGVAAMFTNEQTQWQDHLIGAAVGAAVFLGLYYGCIALLKQEGLGFGDVKFAAAAGLLLGWQKWILAILVASVIGAVVMTVMSRVKHGDKRKSYPFAPHLATGILVAILFGDTIIGWYLKLALGKMVF